MKLLFALSTSLCLLASAAAVAAQPQARSVKLNTGLVIVPFAVPVAVPVATVRQPSVLYSYRSYAGAYAAPDTQPPQPPTPPVETSGDAASLLSRRCASCHRGAAAQGQVRLFDEAGQLVPKLPRQRVLAAVESGRMPLPREAARLTADELESLRRWAQPPRDLEY